MQLLYGIALLAVAGIENASLGQVGNVPPLVLSGFVLQRSGAHEGSGEAHALKLLRGRWSRGTSRQLRMWGRIPPRSVGLLRAWR